MVAGSNEAEEGFAGFFSYNIICGGGGSLRTGFNGGETSSMTLFMAECCVCCCYGSTIDGCSTIAGCFFLRFTFVSLSPNTLKQRVDFRR